MVNRCSLLLNFFNISVNDSGGSKSACSNRVLLLIEFIESGPSAHTFLITQGRLSRSKKMQKKLSKICRCPLQINCYYRPQRSCSKVMFLHLSVHGGVSASGRGVSATPQAAIPWADIPPLGRHPPVQCMLGYGQQAGGTHPTGMHSCFPLSMILKQRNLVVAAELVLSGAQCSLGIFNTQFGTIFA